MKKGDSLRGTFRNLAPSITIDGKTRTYDTENRTETTYATESGSYTTTGYVGLKDPAPTLYDWAGRPIPPVEDTDNEKVRTRNLEAHVADAMPPMRDAIAIEIKSGINLSGAFTAEVLRKTDNKQGRINLPPGYHLRSFTEWVFSKKTADRVFLPVIADLQHDWMEAIGENCPGKARWVIIKGHWHFLTALGLQSTVSIAKRIFDIWKAMSAS